MIAPGWRWLLLGLLLPAQMVLTGAVAAQSVPPGIAPDQAGPVEAIVNRVIDGSSLDAQIGGVRTAVGYLGAETPQLNQPCGTEALARNRELAAQRVLLQADDAYAFDPIGRRLYYATTPDGVSIDETLIREGLARAVRLEAVRGAELAAAQTAAEQAGRGCLWAGR
jgi:endonuclease YncB( thermonuclease family)